METKFNYDSKSLLNYKFSPAQKGYDTLEVDQVFDKIISDYEAYSATVNKLSQENAKCSEKNQELKSEVERLKFELASLNKQYNALKQASKVTGDNYELVTKVATYERVLHRKGINLKKALSDPDNC